MTDRDKGVALAFGAACISGGSVYLNSLAVRAFGDPILYTSAKNVVAVSILILAAAALASRRRTPIFVLPARSRDRIALLAIGVLGGGLAFALFFVGLAQTSAAAAAFVQKTLVIWVAVLAVAVLRERFTVWHAAAIALLVAGQTVAGFSPAVGLGGGEALVFLATLLWSVEVVIVKRTLPRVPALTVACARLGIGLVVLLACVVAFGLGERIANVSPAGWAWTALTGAVLSAYVVTWYAALARASAIDVTAVLVFGAVITALTGAAVSGTLPLATAPALLLITAGALLVARLGPERRSPPEVLGGGRRARHGI
jgi:drug/metabolite transporter (DMT)-like permease